MRMRTVGLLLFLAMLLALPAALALPRYGHGAQKEYVTAVATIGDIVDAVPARGEVLANNTVEVGAEVGGRVQAMLVHPGEHVKMGQLLAVVEPAPYEARIARLRSTVDQAAAKLAVAQADLNLAQSQYERVQKLKLNKTISATDFDKLKFRVQKETGLRDAAIASRDMAIAQLQEARIDLERTRISSPADGIVEQVLVTKGQTINALQNTPVLFQISSQGKQIVVKAEVAEIDIGRIRPDMAIHFSVDAWPGETFQGELVRIGHSPIRQGNFVSYPVEFSAENPDGKLLPGMTAHVTFVQSESRNQTIIPIQALYFLPRGYQPHLSVEDQKRVQDDKKKEGLSDLAARSKAFGMEFGRLLGQGKRLVFVLENGKPARREVRVLAENDDSVAISSDAPTIIPGDTVVLGYATDK